jgi:hypothetical protein
MSSLCNRDSNNDEWFVQFSRKLKMICLSLEILCPEILLPKLQSQITVYFAFIILLYLFIWNKDTIAFISHSGAGLSSNSKHRCMVILL